MMTILLLHFEGSYRKFTLALAFICGLYFYSGLFSVLGQMGGSSGKTNDLLLGCRDVYSQVNTPRVLE